MPNSNPRQDLVCPFCGDTDFDLYGLKLHLLRWCNAFAYTVDPATKTEAGAVTPETSNPPNQ